ncbi:glycosyltransferase family 4 protein [Thioclava sp.]|uniref:glycosyltransferase family 4 protein n=1 Tax=Thioclava sp. TaxID=1933450 RepID=UPI003AA8CBED
MKLIVFGHRLELGGTQINAIELAAHLRDRHGFDIVFHAAPGPALDLVAAHKLVYSPAPDVRLHPSMARIKALRALVTREQPDLIHAWDWWQGLEAYSGVHLPMGVPLVISDMMMELTRAMPREVPTTFGFVGQRDRAVQSGWRRTHLLLPPVDTLANAPGVVDGGAFRQHYGLDEDEIVVVSVSRLAKVMKSEGLVRAIRVIGELGATLPLKLVIVGDGEARGALQQMADKVNARLGRAAVLLIGALRDPRPAYAASDIVLGMGGSALRGLAFAKPLVMIGERGFARLFTPGTVPEFLQNGMFGVGDGAADNLEMAAAFTTLAQDPQMRRTLGDFGRDFVVEHHGLEAVGDGLARFCREAATARPRVTQTVRDVCRTSYYYLRERRFRVASRDQHAKP